MADSRTAAGKTDDEPGIYYCPPSKEVLQTRQKHVKAINE